MARKESELKEYYKNVIDEYYVNGFNGVKAVLAVKGEGCTYNNASAHFKRIYNHALIKPYIAKKQSQLKRKTAIQNENILRELINWAYSDIGDFITLSPEEVKELPPEIRRCIAQVKHKKRTYTTREGREVTDETLELKLVDKIKALDMIGKHIGFYLEDNKQKQVKIDIKQLNVNTLNALLAASINPTNGEDS